jgi:hypothetical protein
MAIPRFRNLFRCGLAGLALTLSLAPAAAIEGGALARGDRLARATVAVGIIGQGESELGFSRCSGVLIAPDLVLTAGHCVSGNPLAAAVVLYEGAKPVRPPYAAAAVARYAVPNDIPADLAGTLRQLSLDTAVLRLAAPIRGRQPIRLSRGARPPASGLRLAGSGLSLQGTGLLKTTRLDPVLMTASGLMIARTRGSEVCSGDSGGPVVADGPNGPVLWGVASAVLTSSPPCGRVVVVAPAAPAAD